MNKDQKIVDFQDYLKEQLKNPALKKHYDEYGKQLEIAYQILRLRKKKKMSQIDLAKKLKTKQQRAPRTWFVSWVSPVVCGCVNH